MTKQELQTAFLTFKSHESHIKTIDQSHKEITALFHKIDLREHHAELQQEQRELKKLAAQTSLRVD